MSIGMGTGGESALDLVRNGMHVIDADGEDIGTVKDVVLGDPEAVTTAGQEDDGTGTVAGVGAIGAGGTVGAVGPVGVLGEYASGASELPEVERSRLLRAGYVQVDLKGLFSGKKYAAGDEVAGVDNDVVTLSVPASRLVG